MVGSTPRKLLDRGDKTDIIEPQEAVLVGFEGRTAENRYMKDGILFQKVSSWLIVVGDADVLPALEMVRKKYVIILCASIRFVYIQYGNMAFFGNELNTRCSWWPWCCSLFSSMLFFLSL